jgi:TonB family protein
LKLWRVQFSFDMNHGGCILRIRLTKSNFANSSNLCNRSADEERYECSHGRPFLEVEQLVAGETLAFFRFLLLFQRRLLCFPIGVSLIQDGLVLRAAIEVATMTDNPKDPRFRDSSSRLDALLSDFLKKEIIIAPDVLELDDRGSATDTRRPREPQSSSGETPLSSDFSAKPLESKHAAPVNRTELWEPTISTSFDSLVDSPLRSSDSSTGQHSSSDNVDRLEHSLGTVLSAKVNSNSRGPILGAVVLLTILLAAGFYFWTESRQRGVRHNEESTAYNSIDSATGQIASKVEASDTEVSSSATQNTTISNVGSMGATLQALPQPSSEINNGATVSQPEKIVATTVAANGVVRRQTSPSGTAEPKKPFFDEKLNSDTQLISQIHNPPAPVTVTSNLPLSAVAGIPTVKPVHLPAPPPSLPTPVIPSPSLATAGPSVGVVTAQMALVKVKPVYPEFARKMNVSGKVEVVFKVNESGKVFEAKAVSGPVLLRASAEDAMRQWRFAPTLINGKAVKATGKLAIVFTGR